MKKRMGLLIAVVIGMLIFVSIGFPFLRTLKTNLGDKDLNEQDNSTNIQNSKVKKIDISVETMCKDPVSGEIDIKCQTEPGCDNLCRMRGCKEFGLVYNGSIFRENRCVCVCYDEGLLKKSLSN